MEELLSSSDHKLKTFSVGDNVSAKLIRLSKRMAIFDVGGKSEAVIVDEYFDDVRKYLRTISPGSVVEAIVVDPETSDGHIMLSLSDTAITLVWERLEKAQKSGKPVVVTGKTASNKGVTFELESLVGFIPASQLGKEVSKNPEDLVDKSFSVKIMDIDKVRGRIVASERAISDAHAIEESAKVLQKVKVGETYQGRVTTVTDFGAFVEIKVGKAAIEGLVHVSELAWEKVANPSDVIEVSDKVEVRVIGKDGTKLALSVKAAQNDPWDSVAKKYEVDTKYVGKITKRSDFGVFVALEAGVEGLVHITKIPPGTDMSIGKQVNVYVEEVNVKERRISLGLVLTSKPVGYK